MCDELTGPEQRLLEACKAIQAMGLFPSVKNFRNHSDYRLPGHLNLTKTRSKLVALGLLKITTEPGVGARGGINLPDHERDLIDRLSLAEPRQSIHDVWKAYNAETGVERPYETVRGWVERIRDRDALESAEFRGDDEAEIKGRIHEEFRQAPRTSVRHTRKAIRMRATLGRVDGGASLTPKEACAAILWDWKHRFGPKKSDAPDDFTDANYTGEVMSVRMEREKGTRTRRRNFSLLGEAMVG
jgi:hypothetical protein